LAICSWETAPSAPLKLNRIVTRSLFNGKETASFPGFQYGMMSGPSTDYNGADLQTLYQAGFPVRILVVLARAKELREKNPGSGQSSAVLLARFDRGTFSWKTSRPSRPGDSEQFLDNFPNWGIMQDGALFQLPMSARLIYGKGSGLWPTPRTTGLDGGSNFRRAAKARGRWPTPRSEDSQSCGPHKGNPDSLNSAVKFWPTPTGGRRGTSAGAGSGGGSFSWGAWRNFVRRRGAVRER
jgi:hypothetical protein